MTTRIDMHDAAHDAWFKLHKDGDEVHYKCKLCGATMYECMDYTHHSACPTQQIERAIDAYFDAVEWHAKQPVEGQS